MKSAVVFLLAGLVLVAAGEGEKKPVERDGIRVWPAVTEPFRKKIEVPVWSVPAAAPDEDAFVEVVVAADETVWCGGASVNLADLRKMLAAHAGRKRDETHPLKPSTVPVLIHAAKGTRWRILQFVMMCAAMPENRMYRIYLSLRDGKGAPVHVPCFLPIDDALGGWRHVPPAIPVDLKREKGETHTRVKLLDREIGVDDAAFRAARQRIAQLVKGGKALIGEINAAAWVPYADVVRAFGIFKSAGVGRVDFFGAPRPSTLVDPNLNRKLDEPAEVPIPGADRLAMITRLLAPVTRGPITVWPAERPSARKEIRVPDWPLPATTPKEREFLEVLVTKDRRLILGGKEVDLKQLTLKFLVWAERSRELTHPSQPSNMPILIHASRDVRWRELQWAMWAAGDPNVRIWKLYFATRTRDGKFAYVPAFLPKDRPRPTGMKWVTVELKRRREETVTRLAFSGQGIGAGDTAFFLLRTYLDEFQNVTTDPFYGEVDAWAWTPFKDVVTAMSAFHAAKIEPLIFVGPPPPGRKNK